MTFQSFSLLSQELIPQFNDYYLDKLSNAEVAFLKQEYVFFTSASGVSFKESCRTKCHVTAAMIRFLSGVEWVISQPRDGLLSSSDVVQIEFNGGDHWITFCASTGDVYHSYHRRHHLRREERVIDPGPITVRRVIEMWSRLFPTDCPLSDKVEILVLEPEQKFKIDFLQISKTLTNNTN